MTNKPFININDLTYDMPRKHGEKIEGISAPIASRIGATKLGYNLSIVPVGKKAFPYHAHLVNEEMFFIRITTFVSLLNKTLGWIIMKVKINRQYQCK